MPVLKAPPQQPRNETLQLRVPEGIKFRLARYAEFIHASPSFIVVELLERLFRKDAEFQAYLLTYTPQSKQPDKSDNLQSPPEDPPK